MSQSSQTNVVAHWSKLFEGLEASATEFYASVEHSLDRRSIPGLKTSRVTWSEGGLLAPDRVYLRVAGSQHVFNICAAPFGTGYFFSSWVTEKKARFVFLKLLLLIAFAAVLSRVFLMALVRPWVVYVGLFGFFFESPLVTAILVPLMMSLVTLWFVAIQARNGNNSLELAVLAIPIVGWFYRSMFAQETYYRTDTMLMFQSAVQAAMLEAIDGLTTQKGVRGLTKDERKPVFHRFM